MLCKLYLTITLFLLIISLSVSSCTEEIPDGFYIEEAYPNGEIKILSRNLKDTLLNNTFKKIRFSKDFNENGNLIREGKYIGSEKIGEHFIYEKRKLKYIKKYEFYSDEDVKFLSDTKIFHDTFVSNIEISYINETISLTNNGKDTVLEESTFVNIKFENRNVKSRDSLRANITYYDSKSHIYMLMLYLNIPEDEDLVDIIHYPGNEYIYSTQTNEIGKKQFSGFAIISVFDIKNKNDTIGGYKVYKINKDYNVY